MDDDSLLVWCERIQMNGRHFLIPFVGSHAL
jgi:hypothetical protein